MTSFIRRWTDLLQVDRDELEEILLTPAGQELAAAAGKNLDFAVYLVDCVREFRAICGAEPHDLDAPAWWQWFQLRKTPEVAALLALHAAPMVRIIEFDEGGEDDPGEQLVCPVCAVADTIEQHEVAARRTEIRLEAGQIRVARGEPGHFDHLRYACSACGSTVRLPRHPRPDYA